MQLNTHGHAHIHTEAGEHVHAYFKFLQYLTKDIYTKLLGPPLWNTVIPSLDGLGVGFWYLIFLGINQSVCTFSYSFEERSIPGISFCNSKKPVSLHQDPILMNSSIHNWFYNLCLQICLIGVSCFSACFSGAWDYLYHNRIFHSNVENKEVTV